MPHAIYHPKINIIDSTIRKLGEGLIISKCKSYIGMVDIIEKKFILIEPDEPKVLLDISLEEIPSAIFKLTNKSAEILDGAGILQIEFSPLKLRRIKLIPQLNNRSDIRGNDGSYIDGEYWFGSMALENTEAGGQLFVVRDGHIDALDNMAIPNTFISFDQEILISDSKNKIVYQYNRLTRERHTWADFNDTNMIPDGGCLGSNGNIYIAMWGAAAVLEFDRMANLISEYRLPILNPTNCCELNGRLIVTSAAIQSFTLQQGLIDGQTIDFGI